MRRVGAVAAALCALAAGCGGDGEGSGTTAADTQDGLAQSPAEAAQAFAPDGGRVVFVAETGTGLAVAGYSQGGVASARVLRAANGRWHALPQGRTVRIRPLGPDPASTVSAGAIQVAAAFSAFQNVEEGGLWLDGRALSAEPHGTPREYTAFGSATVGRGRHTVVAFASAGPSTRAVAWTFRAQ
jgi:hypothetical protein